VFRVLPSIHQGDIWFGAKHFAIKAGQFLRTLFALSPSSRLGMQALA
jgi:hypothetical protein